MQWSHPRGLGILFSVLASGLLIGVFLSGSVVSGQGPSGSTQMNQQLLH